MLLSTESEDLHGSLFRSQIHEWNRSVNSSMIAHSEQTKVYFSQLMLNLLNYDPFTDLVIDQIARTFRTESDQSILSMLHKIIFEINNEYIRENALHCLSAIIRNYRTDFFNEERIKMYVLLYVQSADDELKYLSKIIAHLYRKIPFIRNYVHQQIEIETFFDENYIYDCADLISAISQFNLLIQSNSVQLFHSTSQCYINSKNDEIKICGLEIMIEILQKFTLEYSDIIKKSIEVLDTFIYSENPKLILLTLKVFSILSIPPVKHFEILKTFLSSGDKRLGSIASKLLGQFTQDFFNEFPNENFIELLCDAIDSQPYETSIECLKIVLNYPRTLDDNSIIIAHLLNYAQENNIALFCLQAIIQLILDDETNVLKSLVQQEKDCIYEIYDLRDDQLDQYLDYLLLILQDS